MTASTRRRSRPRSPSRTAIKGTDSRARRHPRHAPLCRRARRRWSARHEGAVLGRGGARRAVARGRGRFALLRRRARAHRRLLRHPQGRDPRHHRPERRRQDLDAQRHQRLLPAAGRAASPSRARNARSDAAVCRGARRHRAHLPESRAVSRHDHARQHHGRPGAEDAQRTSSGSSSATARRSRRRSSIGTGSRRSSTFSKSRRSARFRSAVCPTACRSGSSSAARSPWSRTFCCSTSRWPA